MTDPEAPLRRALKYLSLWAIDADWTVRPPLVLSDLGVRPSADVTGRVLALTLVGLKGQGLSQQEVFAFADSYDVWAALSIAENDFVLDPSPSHHDLVQAAWRFEGAWTLLWAIGLVRHLAFPDRPCDAGKATQLVIAEIATGPSNGRLEVRPLADIVEGAEIAFRLAELADVCRTSGKPLPSSMQIGVVHERSLAFEWLLGSKGHDRSPY